jgi:hypothetical protein
MDMMTRESGFDSQLGQIFFFSPHPDWLCPTQPPIQWIPRALSLGVKQPGLAAMTHFYLLPRVNEDWSYTFTPTLQHHGMVLK